MAALCAWGWLLTAAPAFAQAPPSAPPAAGDDDDLRAQPAEPDFRLVNLPTTLRLPRHRSNFEMTHRFVGNLRTGSFSDQLDNLFGLDQGASIGLGYRYGVMRHVQAGIFRTNIEKTIQMFGKWDAVRQSPSRPLSLSAIVSIEGHDNFRKRRQPGLGAVFGRTVAGTLALYASPFWVRHTAVENGVERDTVFVGLGARARLRRTVYLVMEIAPRVRGYRPGSHVFGVALERRVGGHVFQLNFTNTPSTTFGQIARGGFPHTLHLGFNLTRKFF
jgi:hypothetical protein